MHSCCISREGLLLGALLRTIAMQRLLLPASRAPCAQPLLSKFSTVHLPPLLASQAKNRWVQRSCLPTAAAPPESKKWVCTEIASLLSRATNFPALEQRFLDCGLSRQRDSRLFRAPGPPCCAPVRSMPMCIDAIDVYTYGEDIYRVCLRIIRMDGTYTYGV